MIVCVAEKPSVGKEIAKILGATKSHDGYMEGNGYQVTWTFGHLCCLKAPEDYNKDWKRWTLKDLPLIPTRFGIKLIDDKGIKKQFKIIQGLYSKATEIINCGDAGQEGELIQRWVMQKAGVKCPVKRLWISSLTSESIRQGFKNLKPSSDYQNLYFAGLARACSDWLLGMTASRLYTLSYPAKAAKGSRVFSIGRVQTPTLSMIVSRDREIENFKPSPYYTLSTVYKGVVFNSELGKIEDETKGRILLFGIKDQPFYVDSVLQKNENELPAQLYDLTSLQVECNKKFGLSAQNSLSIIQSLYEKKVSTYPRVDTKYLTDDIYRQCPSIISKVLTNTLGNLKENILSSINLDKLIKSPRVFDNKKVTDHHAIIPTGEDASRAGLSDMEEKVYRLIVKRFISVFMPPCISAKTVVQGHISNKGDVIASNLIKFKASGKTIVSPGWKAVYGKDLSDDKKEKEQVLPDFTKGESGSHIPKLEKKMTTPPKRFTEATLLQFMETAGKMVDDEEMREAMKENGIGRPSSRASIIENIIKKGYVTRQKRELVSTPVGRTLIDIIQSELLKSPALTGTWEKKIRDIEHGKYNLMSFISEIEAKLKELISAVSNDKNSSYTKELKKEQDPLIGTVCPKCGKGKVYRGPYGYYCSRYKQGCHWHKNA